jgi:hypothetical protein
MTTNFHVEETELLLVTRGHGQPDRSASSGRRQGWKVLGIEFH